MKKGYMGNLTEATLENTNFRNVLYTAMHSQLVLMELKPSEEIGIEVHKTVDQLFKFEKGWGKVIVNDTEYRVTSGDVVLIPMGAKHNIINISMTEPLKMLSVYTPPNHKDATVRVSRADAEASSPLFDGVLTEMEGQ